MGGRFGNVVTIPRYMRDLPEGLIVVMSFVYPRNTKELKRTHPNISVHPRSNWKRGKTEHPEKNLLAQSREPTTNSTHIWRQGRATLVEGERSHHCTNPAPLVGFCYLTKTKPA